MLKRTHKFLLSFPKEEQNQVVGQIEEMACFEVEEMDEAQTSASLQENEFLLSSLDFVLEFLAKYAKKESFFSQFNKVKPILTRAKALSLIDKNKLKSEVNEVEQAEKDLGFLRIKIKEEEEKLKSLDTFAKLETKPQDTLHTFALVGLGQLNLLKEISLFAKQNSLLFKALKQDSNKVSFLMLGLKEKKEIALQFLEEKKTPLLSYAFAKGPKAEIALAKASIKESEKKIALLEKNLKNRAVFREQYKTFRDILEIEHSKLKAENSLNKKAFFSHLVFWAKEEDEKELEKKISENAVITPLKLAEDETPPVVLENKKAIRPFEYVTEIFGLPKHNEIDPTPYLAFFFILFFGICITDAAYGLLMALGLGIFMLVKKEAAQNKLIKLLFYGGISTFLVGMLFGSYFGEAPGKIGLPFLTPLKLIDPIEDTLLFMVCAFSLGYLQVFMSQIVKIISGIKNKQREMLLSGLSWGFTYLAGVVLILSFKFATLRMFGLSLLSLGAVSILYVESLGQKIFLKPLVGFIKLLQGVIGTVSDILSYSRLMALGLATAVIALIVNQIAGLFNSMIPYVGFLVMIPILIAGHLFNLGINALGSFIHSGRLQFVEFFPKFLEGGGRRFKPLKSELKYTIIK